MSEKKTEAVNAYLIKNSKGEGGGRGTEGGGWGVGRLSEGVVWVYKIGRR